MARISDETHKNRQKKKQNLDLLQLLQKYNVKKKHLPWLDFSRGFPKSADSQPSPGIRHAKPFSFQALAQKMLSSWPGWNRGFWNWLQLGDETQVKSGEVVDVPDIFHQQKGDLSSWSSGKFTIARMVIQPQFGFVSTILKHQIMSQALQETAFPSWVKYP